MVYYFASFISHLFSPFVSLPFLLFTLLIYSEVQDDTKLMSSFIIILIGICPILLLTILLKKTKKISDWEIRNRQERYPLYIGSIVVGVIVTILLHAIGANYLVKLLLLLTVWLIFMVVINFFWKISGHVGSITLVLLLMMNQFGTRIWPFLVLIPLVAWSRVYRKNHTMAQTIGGFVLAFLTAVIANNIGLV